MLFALSHGQHYFGLKLVHPQQQVPSIHNHISCLRKNICWVSSLHYWSICRKIYVDMTLITAVLYRSNINPFLFQPGIQLSKHLLFVRRFGLLKNASTSGQQTQFPADLFSNNPEFLSPIMISTCDILVSRYHHSNFLDAPLDSPYTFLYQGQTTRPWWYL